MKPLLLYFLSLGLFAAVCASAVHAQDGPENGGHELELWTGGGHSIKGVTSDTGVWTVGGRYGWVLTDSHGPSFLRGKFEYAVDAVPIFWVFQRGGTAYGASLDPVGFKWDFDSHGRIAPYFDLDGGALFTNIQVPLRTSRANFTTTGALGIHILGQRFTWSVDVRFLHISNAGISAANPGINTLQVRIGIGKFTRPRDH